MHAELVQRDLTVLRRWASALERDLRGRLSGTWEVTVDDSFVLTVSRDEQSEQVLLDDSVNEDSWPAEAWAEPYRESTFDEEASEAVGEELLEVLRLWDVTWSPCSEHRAGIQICSATWVCSGPPSHDLAPVGGLSS